MADSWEEYQAESRYFRRIHRCLWCGQRTPRWRAWLLISYCSRCSQRMSTFSGPPCMRMAEWENDLPLGTGPDGPPAQYSGMD